MEIVVAELRGGYQRVGLVHVVDDFLLRHHCHDILRDEANVALPHFLWNPHASVFRHSKHGANDSYVGAIQGLGVLDRVGVQRSAFHLAEIGGNDLGVGIDLGYNSVDFLWRFGNLHVASGSLGLGDKRQQDVVVSCGTEVVERGAFVATGYGCPAPFDYLISCAHFQSV